MRAKAKRLEQRAESRKGETLNAEGIRVHPVATPKVQCKERKAKRGKRDYETTDDGTTKKGE